MQDLVSPFYWRDLEAAATAETQQDWFQGFRTEPDDPLDGGGLSQVEEAVSRQS